MVILMDILDQGFEILCDLVEMVEACIEVTQDLFFNDQADELKQCHPSEIEEGN
jgi:hypothetical protein